jgi:hypothetical protein
LVSLAVEDLVVSPPAFLANVAIGIWNRLAPPVTVY